LLVAFVLFLGCALVEPDADRVSPQDAAAPATERSSPGCGRELRAFLEDDPAAPGPRRARWIDEACRAHRSVVAGLASALFLGGWHLPGWLPPEQEGQGALEIAGAALFVAKAAALIVVVACIRWALPRRRMAERTRATVVWYAPLAGAAFGASAVWSSWTLTGAKQGLVSGSLFVAAALAGFALAARLRHGLIVPGGNGRLSSFL
jgi:hypothetical protein